MLSLVLVLENFIKDLSSIKIIKIIDHCCSLSFQNMPVKLSRKSFEERNRVKNTAILKLF